MISKRLKTIAKYIEPYKSIADVGCDHGYLIIEAFENHQINFAQAIDNKPLPLKSALQNITRGGFSSRVIFTLSDGLTEIWEDIEVVIISGMGGFNIIKILENNPDKRIKRFILQANRNVYDLRKYLMNNSYKIVDEDIIYEDEKYYEIIICEFIDSPVNYTEKELKFGPILLKKRNDVFIDKLKKERDRLMMIEMKIKTVEEKIRKLNDIIYDNK